GFHEAFAVYEMGEDETQVFIVGWRNVHDTADEAVARRGRGEELGRFRFRNLIDGGAAQFRNHMRVTGQKRVQAGDRISDVEELDLVNVGATFLPVVAITDADGADTRLEFLEREGAGTVGFCKVGRAV